MIDEMQGFSIRTDSGRGWDVFMDILRPGKIDELGDSPGGLARAACIPVALDAINFRASQVAAARFTCSAPDLFETMGGDEVDTFDAWYEIEAACVTFGNAYIRVVGDENAVARLDWLHPTMYAPEISSNGRLLGYKAIGSTNGNSLIPANQVIHLRSWNAATPLIGYAPLASALGAINVERLSVAALVGYWARGGRQLGFLTTDQALSENEMEKYKTWWGKLFSSAKDFLKIGMLGGGLKWQGISFDPRELAMQHMRAEDRIDVCLAVGIQPELLGVRQGNYATLREARLQTLENVIIPRLRYYERIFNRKLAGLNLKFEESSLPGLERLQGMHEAKGFRQSGDGDQGEEWSRD